jgi:hypothetical protein
MKSGMAGRIIVSSNITINPKHDKIPSIAHEDLFAVSLPTDNSTGSI